MAHVAVRCRQSREKYNCRLQTAVVCPNTPQTSVLPRMNRGQVEVRLAGRTLTGSRKAPCGALWHAKNRTFPCKSVHLWFMWLSDVGKAVRSTIYDRKWPLYTQKHHTPQFYQGKVEVRSRILCAAAFDWGPKKLYSAPFGMQNNAIVFANPYICGFCGHPM